MLKSAEGHTTEFIVQAGSKNRKEAIKNSTSDLWYFANEIYGNIVSDMTHILMLSKLN